MTRTALTPEAVRDALFERYLRTGSDCTLKELSAEIGVSEPTIRKRLLSPGGLPVFRDIVGSDDERESGSSDYPGMSTGRFHRVTVYGPTRDGLRQRLLAAKEGEGL